MSEEALGCMGSGLFVVVDMLMTKTTHATTKVDVNKDPRIFAICLHSP